MGTSSTAFVLLDNKDVFKIMHDIENALMDFIKTYIKDGLFIDKNNKFPIIKCHPSTKSFYVNFIVNCECRSLSVHFDCDCDYRKYGDSKVIWSINTWGLSEEIILCICKIMKEYGQVFYNLNDSLSDKFIKYI